MYHYYCEPSRGIRENIAGKLKNKKHVPLEVLMQAGLAQHGRPHSHVADDTRVWRRMIMHAVDYCRVQENKPRVDATGLFRFQHMNRRGGRR